MTSSCSSVAAMNGVSSRTSVATTMGAAATAQSVTSVRYSTSVWPGQRTPVASQTQAAFTRAQLQHALGRVPLSVVGTFAVPTELQ